MPKSSNKPVRRHVLLVAVVLIMSGCSQGPVLRVQPVVSQHYAPSSTVEILKIAPSRPYIVIAQIHARAAAGTSPVQVLAAIERKAAAMGADAIMVQNHSQQTAAALQFNAAGGNYQNSPAQIIPIYDATAIRWTTAHVTKSTIEH